VGNLFGVKDYLQCQYYNLPKLWHRVANNIPRLYGKQAAEVEKG
jgi:hypothetical protein